MKLPSILRDGGPPIEVWPTEVWVVYSTVSEFGARGGIVAVASSESTADELAVGKGWWNGKGSIEKKHALVLDDDTVWILECPEALVVDADLPKLRAEKMAAATAKARELLTAEERALLGFKLED